MIIVVAVLTKTAANDILRANRELATLMSLGVSQEVFLQLWSMMLPTFRSPRSCDTEIQGAFDPII